MQAHNFFDGAGNGLFLGTAAGDVYRWNLVDTTTLLLSLLLSAGAGRRVRALAPHPVSGVLWAAVDNAALAGTAAVTLYRFTSRTTWEPHTLSGTQTCNLVAFGGTLWAAIGALDGTQIALWALQADGVTWEVQSSFTGLTAQQPGCLAVFDGRLYFGRLSTTATPMLQVWRSDTTGLAWEPYGDFALLDDPNTSVTALAVARGRLYAATGVPYSGTAPGARVYCRPIAEGITS